MIKFLANELKIEQRIVSQALEKCDRLCKVCYETKYSENCGYCEYCNIKCCKQCSTAESGTQPKRYCKNCMTKYYCTYCKDCTLLYKCNSCDKSYCYEHMKFCKCCDKKYCNDCKHNLDNGYCNINKEYTCQRCDLITDHVHKCRECEDVYCYNCAMLVNKHGYCMTCEEDCCYDCHTFSLDVAFCEYCKEQYCEKCRTVECCSGNECELTICENCNDDCRRCDKCETFFCNNCCDEKLHDGYCSDCESEDDDDDDEESKAK